MATPTTSPLPEEMWHLSMDDLLAPLPERPRLGGPGPFVINLSSSSGPTVVPRSAVVGCEQMHVYQIQRTEDGRPRYRLRVGPFVTEDEADAVLDQVREIYPSALTATADGEDLRAITACQDKLNELRAAAALKQTRIAPAPAVAPAVAPGPAATPAPVAALRAAPLPVAAPSAAAAGTTASVKPAVPHKPAASLRVADPIELAVVPSLSNPSLSSPSLMSQQRTAASAPAKTAVGKSSARSLTPIAVPPLAAPPIAVPPVAAQPIAAQPITLSDVDSTQTLRPMMSLELKDSEASRWFVIQLALAEDIFDPEAVPNLDIFAAYRLYSITGLDQGRTMHALRLGFFADEVAARTVANYVGQYYEKPSIRRVSSAERDRFANQRLEPRKDVGATGTHLAIEITGDRFIRPKKLTSA